MHSEKGRSTRIRFRGTVDHRHLARPLLERAGDTVLVKRGRPRIIVMRCPCGCGDDLIVNLDAHSRDAWTTYETVKGWTLFPSYWRDSGCESHFIVWNDRVFWCRDWWDDEDYDWSISQDIEGAVLQALPKEKFASVLDVANELEVIPWDVLQACRQLVQKKKAIQKLTNEGIQFRRK